MIWDPINELDRLRREIEQSANGSGSRARTAFLPGRAARQYPLVNVHDDGQNFYVEALAPGVDPGNLEVTVVGNRLTLAGEKAALGEVASERIHRTERATGRFVRSIDLPAEVDANAVAAEYQHGLLKLTLPRAEAARPRRVEVKTL
jgi:HSP20 family protein